MRIGLLTYHKPANFGAQLQTVSMVGHLRQLGHQPVVIDWVFKDLEKDYVRRSPIAQLQTHLNFAQDNLPLSERCDNEDDLVRIVDNLDLDLIIIGSDALFKYTTIKQSRYFTKRRLHFIYNPILSCEQVLGNPFFACFSDRLKKRVPVRSYAVSSQNAQYKWMTDKEVETMSSALAHFEYISVRDQWTKDMVKYVTGKEDVTIDPDPVFSFNQNCYLPIPTKEEIIKKYNLDEEYILVSFGSKYSDATYIRNLVKTIEEKGIQVVSLPTPEGRFDDGAKHIIPMPISPLEWYALIKHSHGYIGERMHPIVVCLHNNVPFFSFDEYGFKERKLFFLRKKYIRSSSKTFLILEEAGLLNNIFSYQAGGPLPQYELVIDAVMNFDIKKCQQFSLTKREQFVQGINNLITYKKE